MIEQGLAYRCYCTKERLEELRHTQEQTKKTTAMTATACTITAIRLMNHTLYALKPNWKRSVEAWWCRAWSHWISNSELDDLIIRRTDGSPTYNFCVVVDDWDMGITHVVRGEDHINNTPRQINILKALGAPIPTYAHVSMINGDDGQTLKTPRCGKRNNTVMTATYQKPSLTTSCLGWDTAIKRSSPVKKWSNYLFTGQQIGVQHWKITMVESALYA